MKKTPPKTATPPAAAPVATQPPEVEDWVNDTPYETLYTIEMWQQEIVETIDLTRAEYIALKGHLAGLRGIIPVAAEPVTEPIAAPVSKLDPMNVLAKFSPEQEQEVRDALLARLRQQLGGMRTHEVRQIAWYANIEEAKGGCDTPAEDFITGLVLDYQIRGLTPDDAAHRLEEFRENFDSMAKAASIFAARYPEAVKSATAA